MNLKAIMSGNISQNLNLKIKEGELALVINWIW